MNHNNPLVSASKAVYRRGKWFYLNLISRGHIDEMTIIEPSAIKLGQTPESQFPPKKFYGGFRGGDWDKRVIPVESHPLYESYVQHFQKDIPWEETPFFTFALKSIEQGRPFRGEYKTPDELLLRFEKCDRLYKTIAKEGYKSNHQRYKEGTLRNVLELMDEVTVNLARDGSVILNDGWHRFVTARLLDIPSIPARICARHIDLRDR